MIFSGIEQLGQDPEVRLIEHFVKDQRLLLTLTFPYNKYFIKLMSEDVLVPLIFVRYYYNC